MEMCTDLWKWQKMNPFGYKAPEAKTQAGRKDSATTVEQAQEIVA
jgi:hypothetical protein